MQTFAVSCGYNPETVKDDEFVEKVVKKMTLWNGTAPEPASINNFRGLFLDCIQALLADTRAKYDPRTEDLPCRLGTHDRRHRRKQTRDRMKGAVPDIMQRELEPSHAAEDDLFAMFKDDCLGPYMGPEDFPTRTQEITFKPKGKSRRPEPRGAALWQFITGEEQEVERPLANTSKERSLEYAFKR